MSDELALRRWADGGDGGEWFRNVEITADGEGSWILALEETFAGDVGAPDFVLCGWVFYGSSPAEALSAAVEWIESQPERDGSVSPRASVSVDFGDEKVDHGRDSIEIVREEGVGIVVPPALVDACQRLVTPGVPNGPDVFGPRDLVKQIADLAPLHPAISALVETKKSAERELRRSFGDPDDDEVGIPSGPERGR